MSLRKIQSSIIIAVVAFFAFIQCRSAVYEIINPKKDRRDQGDRIGPNNGENPGPTAAIEVIKEGKSVTKVRVDEAVIIRPTADTVDPDDLGKSNCPNPGIFRSQYQVASETSLEVNRGAKCDDLGVSYTFKAGGDFLITLTVTTEEGETALASMTVHVLAANAPLDEDGGFLIKASPMILGVGQETTLTGICTTNKAHQITWNFGDGTSGEGASTKHAFGKTGSYRLEAACRETVSGGRTWQASVTVVVMANPVTPPSSNTSPGYEIPSGGGNGETGQNGQDKPGQVPGAPIPPVPPGPNPGANPKRCHIFIFSWAC